MEDIIERYRSEVILDGLKLENPLPKVCALLNEELMGKKGAGVGGASILDVPVYGLK